MAMETRVQNWHGLCESIGGEEAVVARLGQLIHAQRATSPHEQFKTCRACDERAREFFDAAAEAEWWPLGYGVFKLLSNLMGCTETERKYAPSDEAEE